MGEPSRRRVTYGQLEHLWECLSRQKALAIGFNKTAQARELSRKMWLEVAQNLNSHADGAVKDWKGWCKYWNDYKSKLKRIAVASRASHQATGGGPSTIKALSEIETKFLQILGKDYGFGLPGIRVEPFAIVPDTISEPINISGGSESILAGKDVPSVLVQYDATSPSTHPQPGPSQQQTPPRRSPRNLCQSFNPYATPPRPTSTQQQVIPRRSPRRPLSMSPQSRVPDPSTRSPRRPPSMSPQSRVPDPSTRSPRRPQPYLTPHIAQTPTQPTPAPERRRRSRRSLSVEEARRVLVEETKRRTTIEEQKTDMLRMLLDEFREFKQMFCQW